MTEAVKFKDFSFAYRGQNQALEQINLSVRQGAFSVITGPSGAGKTTLCMAVSGLVPHYFGGAVAGSVYIDGIDTMQSRVSLLADKVGTVLEDYESQLVAMTVEEEVAFSLENRGLNRQEIERHLKEALDMVGLKGLERREVGALSGGQKQRLALAAVLASRPDILVLDEPASALDPEGAEELYALLGDLNKRGITVLVVEHDLARVMPYATQLVLMDGGRVLKCGTIFETLDYMHTFGAYGECLPALWEIKLHLEREGNFRFEDWRRPEDAVADLAKLLQFLKAEVSKSA